MNAGEKKKKIIEIVEKVKSEKTLERLLHFTLLLYSREVSHTPHTKEP